MKVNVEKALHELAQWHHNQARSIAKTQGPSSQELASVHEYTNDILRMSHASIRAKRDRIEALESALKDVSKYIWRGDFNHLEESTREILNDLECDGRQDKHNA